MFIPSWLGRKERGKMTSKHRTTQKVLQKCQPFDLLYATWIMLMCSVMVAAQSGWPYTLEILNTVCFHCCIRWQYSLTLLKAKCKRFWTSFVLACVTPTAENNFCRSNFAQLHMRDLKVFIFWLQLFSDNRLLSSSSIAQI